MSKSRRRRFHEPSLVPLADMLTNTVGIIVFILIFTVLSAGGVVVAKRLPMERTTTAQSVDFLCRGDRVLPLNDKLFEDFFGPIGNEPPSQSLDGYRTWVARINDRQVEDEHVLLKGEAEVKVSMPYYRIDLTLVCTSREGKGEAGKELRSESSCFRRILGEHDPSKQFVLFYVWPDGVESFTTARDLAVESGFATGWSPQQKPEIRFGSAGFRAVPQN
jgi:hypothetical protein